MDLFVLTKPLHARQWFVYLVAVVAPLIAFWVRLKTGFPFLPFFPAVLLAAFFGGWRPGALACLLSGAIATYYFIGPQNSFAVDGISGPIGLAFFVLASAIMVGLVEALRQMNETLETRVVERTRELVEANAKRQHAEAQTRQAQKMDALGQLTGGIAHDFNNMLAIVIGSLDVAHRRLARGDADIMNFIDIGLDGANRAAGLTRRLLAFSRQQPLDPVVTELNALVQGMAELLRRTIGETIDLECALAGGLWRTCVDQPQLESAILNLAVNARDAMPEGGKLTIETLNAHLDDAYATAHSEVAPGHYAVVAVSDTGVGMTREIAERAFDPFFTTKGIGRGTGLGLSQVYGFVKQSGGHVKIYSEVDRGTTVKIYLPRNIIEDGAAVANRRAPTETALPAGAPEEIILVVEDEEQVRRTTVESLRELGYTVRHAGSAKDALTILEEQVGVKLLFTDVVMPGMTGSQLVDVVAERLPDLKVLYTTGYTRNAIVRHGVVDQHVHLLTKPFALEQLALKVRHVLDSGPR
jgi:signal transduction histidine kinase/CheY-like chemotaxis protein